jgi:hypothetical protein
LGGKGSWISFNGCQKWAIDGHEFIGTIQGHPELAHLAIPTQQLEVYDELANHDPDSTNFSDND